MGEFVRVEKPDRGRRRWRGCCCGLALLALPLLVWFVALEVTGFEVRQEVDRIRRQGEPVTLADAVKSIPVGQPNAATLYLAPQPRDPQPVPPGTEFALDSDAWSPGYLARTRAAVEANQPYFESVLAATRVQPCAFPSSADGSYQTAQVRAEQLWEEAQALQMLAELQSHDGDVNAAAATSLALFRMSEHLRTAPTSLDHSRARQIGSLALSELARVLARATPAEAVLEQLARQLASCDAAKVAAAEVIATRTTGLATLARLEKGDLPELMRSAAPVQGDLGLVLDLTVMRPRWNVQKLNYLRLMAHAVTAMGEPWPDAKRDIEEIEREVQAAPVSSVVGSRRVIPSLRHLLYERQRHASVQGGAQVAIALLRWRLRHGSYPDSLAPVERELGRLPTDPYSHQPFHYRASATALVVWSVGPDRTMKQGKRLTPRGPNPDFTFTSDRSALARMAAPESEDDETLLGLSNGRSGRSMYRGLGPGRRVWR